MPKIVLIRPKSNVDSLFPGSPRIPLALLCVGSILSEEGYDVRIIDTVLGNENTDLIDRECRDAMLVGITALTSEVKNGLEISKLIKEKHNVPIIWGGIHPTLFPVLTCEDPLIDYVVIGEGEYTLLELVRALENSSPLDRIAGLGYKQENEVKINPPRPYADVEKLPPINYDMVEMGKYLGSGIWRRAIDFQSSRGCPYRCKFCVNPATGNHKIRAMSAKKVADECERLVNTYGVDYVTFVDDNFFLNKRRAKEICETFIQRNLGIYWFAEVRADYFRTGFIDEEFLGLAEKSGLTNLTIGAESGVPQLLELIGKDINVDDTIQSAKMLARTGIITAYSFIIGLPEERREDVLDTLHFVETLWKIYPAASYTITTLRAYPGSELTDYFVKQGFIQEPLSLREFADDSYNKIYTESPAKLPWHCDPGLVYSVAQYSSVAYGPFSSKKIGEDLKGISFVLWPEHILQKTARLRLRYQFFRFPIDMWFRKMLHKAYDSRFARYLMKRKTTSNNTSKKRHLPKILE